MGLPMGVLSRVHEIVAANMRPENICLSDDADGDEQELFPVLANLKKPLNVPRFFHNVLASRLNRMTSTYSPPVTLAAPSAPSLLSGTGVTNDAALEKASEETICRLRDVLENESEWDVNVIGMSGEGISTSTRPVPGSKWPMYQASFTMELPARFDNSLESAIAECCALYLSHSGAKLVDKTYDKAFHLRRSRSCSAMWRGLMPSMDRGPSDFMVVRGMQISASLGGVEAIFASTSLPKEIEEQILSDLPEDAKFLSEHVQEHKYVRSRLGLSGFRIRGIRRQGESPLIEFSYVVNPILNMGPALKVPEFLIRKELLLLPSAWLSRYRELFVHGLTPEVIAASGGFDASAVPSVVGPKVVADLAGHSRTLDAWTYDLIRPLLEKD